MVIIFSQCIPSRQVNQKKYFVLLLCVLCVKRKCNWAVSLIFRLFNYRWKSNYRAMFRNWWVAVTPCTSTGEIIRSKLAWKSVIVTHFHGLPQSFQGSIGIALRIDTVTSLQIRSNSYRSYRLILYCSNWESHKIIHTNFQNSGWE